MNNKLLPFMVEGKLDTEALGARYSWKPLSKAIAEEAMEYYKANLPGWAKETGDGSSLFTKSGALICNGYERIVIGHYGAYVEFNHLQANKESFITKPGQEYREEPRYSAVKYLWHTHKDDISIKIYLQKRTVSYADYLIDRYYVSVNDVTPVAVIRNEPDERIVKVGIAYTPPTKTLVVTGHRPDKLGRTGGYDIEDSSYDDIRNYFRNIICLCVAKYGKGNVILINGGALGIDQLAAIVALEEGIAVYTYIPFKGQERAWKSSKDIERYQYILLHSRRVIDCSEGEHPTSKGEVVKLLLGRNERMVDDGDHVIAVFDGGKSGGTFKCIQYAIKKGVRVTAYNQYTRKTTNDLKL